MTTPTQPTIVARNPLPADIDWSRVESELGVRIIHRAPSDSVGPFDRVEPGLDCVEAMDDVLKGLRAIGREITETLEHSQGLLVSLGESGVQLGLRMVVGHGSPQSSVASASSSQGAAPEGSDVEGSASADSSTSWDFATLVAQQRETNALLRQIGDHISALVAAQSVNVKGAGINVARSRKRK